MSFRCLFCLLVLTLSAQPARSQLSQTLDVIFDSFLREGFVSGPGEHAGHFVPAAERASSELTPALNSLIAGNVASFPLASTVAGVTFNPVTGEILISSLGPIFSEPVETVGKGNFTVGVNATVLSLNEFRGLSTDQIRFTFLHEDVGEPGLGDSPNESDVLDLILDLDVDASIAVLYATVGISRNLDVSLAIPIVSVSMYGNASARINSSTLLLIDRANHTFGGDLENPILDKVVSYDESSTGLGDLALRFKYRFSDVNSVNGVAALLDMRLPTGDAEEFLGTGNFAARAIIIGSSRMGEFTPHINVGYNYRSGDIESDRFEVILGFDQVIFTQWVFAFEFLGAFDLDSSKTIDIFSGTETIHGDRVDIVVDLSNVPERDNDNRMDMAVGVRYAPVLRPTLQLQLLANIIVPLQDGGLRSGIAPTLGVSVSF